MVAHDQAGGVQHCNEALFLSHIITDRSLETINLISCTNHSNPFSSSTFQSPLSTRLASISESFFSAPPLFPQKNHIVKWEGPLMWSSVGPLVSLEWIYNPTEHISAVTTWRKTLHLKKHLLSSSVGRSRGSTDGEWPFHRLNCTAVWPVLVNWFTVWKRAQGVFVEVYVCLL